jgi:hypothetical protein
MTIPPVLNGIDIRNPIAAEDETNVVDQGVVDYARIYKDQSNEELPTFDWTGAYNKTEWVHHDVITENKMNKIEDALYSINANVKESDVVMLNALDQFKKDADAYVKENMAEVEQDVAELERSLKANVKQFKIDTNSAMTAHRNEVNEQLSSFNSNIASHRNEVNGQLNEVSRELDNVDSQLRYILSKDANYYPLRAKILEGVMPEGDRIPYPNNATKDNILILSAQVKNSNNFWLSDTYTMLNNGIQISNYYSGREFKILYIELR